MGVSEMETAEGEALSSIAISVGIAVTQASLKTGLASYRYWYPVIQAFRSVNEERARRGSPHFPEELLLILQTHLRAEGAKIGLQTCKNVVSDHDLKLIDKNFSLIIQGINTRFKFGQTPHLYLSIPWDLCHQSSVSKHGMPQSGKCCKSAVTSTFQSLNAGEGAEDARNSEVFLVDQDLQITRKKILSINKAIRDLGPTVYNSEQGLTRFTECDVSTTFDDVQFRSTSDPKGGKLWMPRVIMFQQTELVLREGRED